MLTNILFNCRKAVVTTCILSLALSVNAASKKDEALDLSILKQRNALAQTMDKSQRVDLLQLEAVIKQAKSDITSAEFMISTKPGAFKSADEVKEINERGENLMEDAQARLLAGQTALVEFLETAHGARAATQAQAAVKFNFTIESSNYDAAFETSTRELLNEARSKGYKTIFFDNVFVTNESGTEAIAPEARNLAYDKLIEIDGTNYAVQVPIGLKINDESKLSFDNIDDYQKDKLALLAIELIQESPDAGLLYARLIDLRSFQIISQKLTNVSEFNAHVFAPESNEGSEEAETTDSDETVEAVATETVETKLVTGAEVVDAGQWLDRLASQAYNFRVSTEADNSIIPSILLTHTVLDQTSMKIVDAAFIARAYGSEEAQPEAEVGAQLTLTADAENFKLSAYSYTNERSLDIGSVTVTYK